MNFCFVAAVGTGSRMHVEDKENGEVLPKQYVELSGKPIIAYTLDTIVSLRLYDYIVIGISEKYHDLMTNIINEYQYPKEVICIVHCVGNRMDTFFTMYEKAVSLGMREEDYITFTDANRPFTRGEIYSKTLKLAKETGIAVPVLDLIDGVCYVEHDTIKEIPNKNSLRRFQTPESFSNSSFIKINALKNDKSYLGIAEMYMGNGIKPSIVKNDRLSFKITFDIDLLLARQVIKELSGI